MDRPVILASTSPRRRELLSAAAGGAGGGAAGGKGRERFPLVALDPRIDDGELMPGGVEPRSWVMSVAFLKAQAVARRLRGNHAEGARETSLSPAQLRRAIVVGADTMVVLGETMIGKPADAAAARATLLSLGLGEAPSPDAPHTWVCHEVLTGVAIIELESQHRELFAQRTLVRMGGLSPAMLDTYIASGAWRGKAGGYNLPEVRAAGWPVACEGDEDNVAGLPMAALMRRLSQRGVGLPPGPEGEVA